MKKKIILVLGIVLLVILILCLSSKISSSQIPEILNIDTEIPNNVYIKEEMINNANTTLITEIYKKDNNMYVHIENDDFTRNEDIFWEIDKNREIIVDNIYKTIDFVELEEGIYSNYLRHAFPNLKKVFSENKEKYKYYGEENINGKNCAKFSLTQEADGITYFYVSTDDNFLYQKEEGQYYKNKLTINYKYNYTYSLDTVSDDDILKFEEGNYVDYTYIDDNMLNIEQNNYTYNN